MYTISTALQTHTQTILTQLLREFFKQLPQLAPSAGLDFSPIFAESKAAILSEFPTRQTQYPCVVIGGVSGNPLLRTIGREFYQEIRGPRSVNGVTITNALCGITLGGGHTINVPIYIAAQTTAQRRIIKDYIAVFLRTLYRTTLAHNDLNLISVEMGLGTEKVIGNQMVFFDELRLSFYTEWKQVIWDVPLVSSVNLIGMTIYN